MRIISQDGTIDAPYNCFTLSVTSGKYNEVEVAYINGSHGVRFAEYSSKKKAVKAMEMLRNTYTAKEWKPSVVNKNGEVLEEMQFFDEKRYFQFPKDDEVEA